jgi:alpha-beta hydrolase superfamily lysophospholipase
MTSAGSAQHSREVLVPVDGRSLPGTLTVPSPCRGLVVFAHGSGSSRHSPRNRQVAEALHERGIGTLLFDLLSEAEAEDRALVFDIPLLAGRLAQAAEWIARQPEARGLPLGYFGASTGGGAALAATVTGRTRVTAVVSRGGRPDLAGPVLAEVRTPTLLIVGGDDEPVLSLNRAALARMGAGHRLVVMPGATHLFEEPGALERVARLAADWFDERFGDARES